MNTLILHAATRGMPLKPTEISKTPLLNAMDGGLPPTKSSALKITPTVRNASTDDFSGE